MAYVLAGYSHTYKHIYTYLVLCKNFKERHCLIVSALFYRKNLNRLQSFLKRFVNKVVYRCDILRTSKYGETEKKVKCLKCKETARSG